MISDDCLWVRSHKVKEIKDKENGGLTGTGNMKAAMMSLPAALDIASHQGQTGQKQLVYLMGKKNTSFLFSLAFLVSLSKPSLAATNKKHMGHF